MQVQTNNAITAIHTCQCDILNDASNISLTIICIGFARAYSVINLGWSHRWPYLQVQYIHTVTTIFSLHRVGIGTCFSICLTAPLISYACACTAIGHLWQNLWQYSQIQYGNTITSVHYASQSMIVHTSGLVYIAEPIY